MKRLHIHMSVENLDQSIRFYSTLFAAEPTVVKSDYAKWMLDDPRINFAISTRGGATGVDHLGFQTDNRIAVDILVNQASGQAGRGQLASDVERLLAAVTVMPGDSLWTIATEVAPNADPQSVVTAIVDLNQLESATVQPGQQIASPAEFSK